MVSEKQGKRLALVVGVDYAPQSRKASLHYARQDAEDVAKALREPYCRFDEITLLQNDQALTGTVQDVFTKTISSANAQDDLLLFYFAGHGIQMTRPQGNPDVFLVTYDFDYDNATINPARYISLSWLRDMLYSKMTRTGNIVLILDNCYAGFMTEQPIEKTFLESTDFAQLSDIFNDLLLLRGERLQPSGQGLRRVFAATGSNDQAREREGHGAMTGYILSALQGNEPSTKNDEGQVTVARLYPFLQERMFRDALMPLDYQGTDRNRPPCVLAYHDSVAIQAASSRPALRFFVPHDLAQHFQVREGEFAELLRRLKTTSGKPLGLIGMPGCGKKQLAAQFAYAHDAEFKDGVYWVDVSDPVPVENRLEIWRARFARLARQVGYRPSSEQDTEEGLASQFAAYLARCQEVLLILAGVEEPGEMTKLLTALAGRPMQCAILYTSISLYQADYLTTYQVPPLTEEQAYRLLLPDRLSATLAALLEGRPLDVEATASRTICRYLANHPLALTVLRGFLSEEPDLTLGFLASELGKRGFFAVTQEAQVSTEDVLKMFAMVWERIHHPAAERLFKLLAYYPEIAAIPLWLAGLTAGLDDEGDVLSPLHKAWRRLHNLSLVTYLPELQVLQFHPMLREFGKRLTREEEEQAKLREAGQRLATALADLSLLEERARLDYWTCLDQFRAAISYIRALAEGNTTGSLVPIERALDRESHLLAVGNFWPERFPALFYQQIANRLTEQRVPLGPQNELPEALWLRLLRRIGAGAERQRILSGHEREVTVVAFSPDGAEILTASEDGEAHILDTASGRIQARLRKHVDGVTSASFSPDGTRLLTASHDGTVLLWSWERTFFLAQDIAVFPHPGEVSSVAFAPDGLRFLSGAYDGVARLWDCQSGMVVQTFAGHRQPVSCVAFSPDGFTVLTGSWDDTARLWEVSTGQEVMAFGYQVRREWPSYKPYLVNALTEETILQSGINEFQPDDHHVMTGVAFSPGGRHILTSSNDSRVWLWEISSGQMVRAFTHPQVEVTSVAFSPDGRLILTGAGDGAVRVFEVETGNLLTMFRASGRIRSAIFSPNGTDLLAGSNDHRVRLWHVPDKVLESQQMASQPPLIFVSQVSLGSVSEVFQGKTRLLLKVISGFENGEVWLWEQRPQEPLRITLQTPAQNSPVTSLAFDEQCRTFLVGYANGCVQRWEIPARAPTRGLRQLNQLQHEREISATLYLPDHKSMLSAAWDGKASIWTAGSEGKADLTVTHPIHYSGPITCAAVSHDGQHLLLGLADGRLILTAAKRKNEKLLWQGHTGALTGLAFLPDDRYLLTSGIDTRTCLWDGQDGALIAELAEQTDEVRAFAFSPSGRLLLACNQRGNLTRLWTIDTSGQTPICELRGIYNTHYPISTALWLGEREFMLADTGDTSCHPSFYQVWVENLT